MSLGITVFLASLAASMVSFAGGFVAIFNEEKMRRATHFIVSFAVGALLAVALLELIPEAAELGTLERIMPFVLGGAILFFVLEKFLFWYHCHDGSCPVHTYPYLILWGDFLHNFLDGILMGLAFLTDVRLGMATTLAVILHEIPQEISDFSLLVHGGFSRSRALWYNFLSATSVILGALGTYALGGALEAFLPFGLAIAAGAFIYLALADLLPELHESTTTWHGFVQVTFMLIGVVIVLAPEFLGI